MFIRYSFDWGEEKESKIIKEILNIYDSLELKVIPNNSLYTKYFLEEYPSYKLNNKFQELENGVVIYLKEYFERPTFNKEMGNTVHHFSASWKKKSKSDIAKKTLRVLIGDVLYKKFAHRNSITKPPFYNLYLQHKKE
ncbi:hypothetical protein M0L17_01595 [Bacillaceae bacterium OS4b]|nr:hypothetical protein [Bacillaceae bacterium OS4b]